LGSGVAAPEAGVQTPTDTAAVDAAAAEAAAAAKVTADAEAEAAKPPEKYEFKLPEGVTMDSEILGDFEGLARELGLSQDGAQKVADLGVKQTAKFVAAQQEAFDKTSKGWLASLTTDKEFGGDALPENLAVANKALKAFGNPALNTLLKETRLENHPEIVRAFFKAGKAISEDTLVTGGAGAKAETSAADKLYPSKT
jgi:hypothetical protein